MNAIGSPPPSLAPQSLASADVAPPPAPGSELVVVGDVVPPPPPLVTRTMTTTAAATITARRMTKGKIRRFLEPGCSAGEGSRLSAHWTLASPYLSVAVYD